MRTCSFQTKSVIQEIPGVVSRLVAFCQESGLDEESLVDIEIAATEALANAICHGNKSNPDTLVEITAEDFDSSLSISIRDFGEGFSLETVPDPCVEENLLAPSGRGILMIKALMDEVSWENLEDGGTIIIMSKSKA